MAERIKLEMDFAVNYNYEVHFLRGIFFLSEKLLRDVIASKENRPHRVLFIVEEELTSHYPELINDINSYCKHYTDDIIACSEPVILGGGENLKTFEIVEELCSVMEKNKLCRQSFVCIVGGGAFLDTVGFAASIVHRGIRQIRIPTTVLAQNDSGVGVKNGLNMFSKKNFIGTFSPPFAVINDLNFLETLEYRDWISGTAEAFKVAMIKDAEFFRWLCENSKVLADRDQEAMDYLVRKCAEIHIDHIARNGDPFEFGSARPLDFGHWSAHKLEMLSQEELRHGEAVAIGLVLDTFYAVQLNRIDMEVLETMIKAFNELGFKLWMPELEEKDSSGRLKLLEGLTEFREHLGGDLHITLPDGLGRKFEVNEIDEDIILQGINYIKKIGN